MSAPTVPVHDPRGAPMGRCSSTPTTALGRKFSLTRVRLDRWGYDRGGAYWGIGAPLYYAQSMDEGEPLDTYTRAWSRDDAKKKVRVHFKGARFFR